MKLNFGLLETCRVRGGPFATMDGEDFGAFFISGPCGQELKVLASPGGVDGIDNIRWEHVSVSTRHRTPNWKEMCFIKDLFFDAEEAVMQLHPPKSRYVNTHEHCLHLWRPLDDTIPLPPMVAV